MINFTYKETFLTMRIANDWRRTEALREALNLCELWSEDGDKRSECGKTCNSQEGSK